MMQVTSLRRLIPGITLLLTLLRPAIAGTWAQAAAPDQSRLTAAAAADLGPALADLARTFEKRTGTPVSLVFGSSGNLAMQIEHGAPYDVFFSADTSYPHQLEKEGLAVPGSLYVYARGELVLLAPHNSPLHLQQLGMQALLDPRVRKIAIANPQHAPYGRAAVAAMKKADVYAASREKLVLGENVSQAAQFVISGNAQLGIISLSLALAPGMTGRYWELPPSSYPPLDQAVIMLKNAKARTAAESFLQFLKSPEAAAIWQHYRFQVPEPK